MALFIVPPPCGCGCRIRATGARGRRPGLKRPSRRPSGPGKMTSGIEARYVGVARTGRAYIGGSRTSAIMGGKRAIPPVTTRIYLDHAATTPVIPQARAALQRGMDAWANPSSPHAEGRGSRALLEEARAT